MSEQLTVLMPVYNGEQYIMEAVESALCQSFREFELLIVDDCSSDGTSEILHGFRDPRMRILRNDERLKLAGALNRGMAEARGRYIARMDADDIMRPDRLQLQLDYLESHPAVGCCGGWVRTFGDGAKELREYPAGEERVKAFALFYAPFAHPAVMFRKEWFEREQLRYDGSYYPTEDYELWSRAMFSFPCDNLQRVLVDYRVHGKSMTGGEWSDMDAQTVKVHHGILARLGIEPSTEEARIHREASMGLLPAAEKSFETTEAWLLKLADANRTKRVFAQDAMEDILNYVWFRQAMAVVRKMGNDAWKLYSVSSLAGYGAHARKRRWTVHAAALKAALTRSRS